MPSPSPARAPVGRARETWLVLVLICGVLALHVLLLCHVLAGPGHTRAGHAAAGAGAVSPHVTVLPGVDPATVATPDAGGPPHRMPVDICLAVLAGAGMLAWLAGARRARRGSGGIRALGDRVRERAARAPPPRRSVLELCVLRT